MKRLTVVYDQACALCKRCRYWMEHQHAYVALEFLPSDSPAARRRYGTLPWLGEELVVVSDEGDVWIGPAAFLVCLWALCEHRQWSYRLSSPTLAPLAERFFHALSSNRGWIASWIEPAGCPEATAAPTRTPAVTIDDSVSQASALPVRFDEALPFRRA